LKQQYHISMKIHSSRIMMEELTSQVTQECA